MDRPANMDRFCTPSAELGDESGRARLAYVAVADEPRPVHVSRYAELASAARPKVQCPVCRQVVTLRLGRRRVHHAAHRPGDRCAVTALETALHLNTKLYLAEQLLRAAGQGGASLLVRVPCTGYRLPATFGREPPWSDAWRHVTCAATSAEVWLAGWDEVDVELAVGSHRPDITLSRAGRVVGLIEVFVSHEVSAPKAAGLAAAGMPWLEVAAREVASAGAEAWTAAVPLPPRQLVPALSWQCAVCRDGEIRGRAQLQAAREARQSAVRGGYVAPARRPRRLTPTLDTREPRPWRGRLLDVYSPDGRRVRYYLEAAGMLRDGRLCAVHLWRIGDDDPFARLPYENRHQLEHDLARAYDDYLARYVANGDVVDSPMGWLRLRQWPALASSLVYNRGLFPPRYKWSTPHRAWVPCPDQAHLRWDRPETLERLQELARRFASGAVR